MQVPEIKRQALPPRKRAFSRFELALGALLVATFVLGFGMVLYVEVAGPGSRILPDPRQAAEWLLWVCEPLLGPR